MPTVLVVDDSAVDRQVVSGLLAQESNLKLKFAEDGRQALAAIHQQPPDLVLADLLMPQMDGLELVAAVTSGFPLVPVILITGKGSEEIAVEALRAGASSYVPKRVLASRLLATVHQVLELARRERNQAELMHCMSRCEFRFELCNDTAMLPPLVDYLHRSLRAVGVCDEVGAIRVCVALEEALNNAICHGNLEIPSRLRDGDNHQFQQLLVYRQGLEPYRQRRVLVDVCVSRDEARFTIHDQGPGFDYRDLPDPTQPENLDRLCGRGILLMQTFMDEVDFQPPGNRVTLVKRRKVEA